MKKSIKIFVSGILATSLLTSGLAMAHQRTRGQNGKKYCDERKGGMKKMKFKAGRYLLREEMDQVMSQSISELSGKSIAEVSSDIKTHSKSALLMKYNIDRENLHETMKTKVDALIIKAAEEGRITTEGKESMLNRQ